MYKETVKVIEIAKAEPDDPNSFSDHHRKPRSLNGKHYKRNLSSVPLFKHKAWHVLYEDFDAFDTQALFAQDYEVYGTDFIKSPLLKKLHEGYANNTAEKIKRRVAWYTLFSDKTLEEIVEEINTVWLDPDYEILIGMIRVKTVQLKAKVGIKSRKKLTRKER